MLDGRAHRLATDECGLIPLGVTHAWRNGGDDQARWLEMTAPAPRQAAPPDTFFTGDAVPQHEGEPPSNHSYRFDRDWDYLAARLAESGR